ncbi:MAG: DNA-binding transcriptional LysR family regulator [Parasphingorhabdus sp.]
MNFTRAAEERNVTQPAFSRRIRSLEIWSGTSLIDRSTYPIRLTVAGNEFLPVAKDIVSTLISNRDMLREHDRGGLSFQSFTATHSVSINHIAPLVEKLQQVTPDLRTRVVSDNLHACCHRLSEGDCDFLLCYRHPEVALTLDEQQYHRLTLDSERLVPVSKCDSSGQPLWQLADAASQPVPLLAYASGSFLGAVVQRQIANHDFNLDVRHVDAFAESLKSLVLQGVGMAWLPEGSVRASMEQGLVTYAGPKEYSETLYLSIFTDPSRLNEQGLLLWNWLKLNNPL